MSALRSKGQKQKEVIKDPNDSEEPIIKKVEVEQDDGDDAVHSAAYFKENKVPVELPTSSRKRVRASPLRKGHILSPTELEKLYPHMNSCDNSEIGDGVKVFAEDDMKCDVNNANEEDEVN